MAIPANAVRMTQPVDPYDVLDFYVALSQGSADATPPPVLLTGESIAALQLAVTAEAAAVGLQIKSGNGYPAPAVDGQNVVSFWLGVAEAQQGNAAFNAAGIEVALELSITTTNIPPRKKQRTIVVTIAQQ